MRVRHRGQCAARPIADRHLAVIAEGHRRCGRRDRVIGTARRVRARVGLPHQAVQRVIAEGCLHAVAIGARLQQSVVGVGVGRRQHRPGPKRIHIRVHLRLIGTRQPSQRIIVEDATLSTLRHPGQGVQNIVAVHRLIAEAPRDRVLIDRKHPTQPVGDAKP